MDLSVVIPLYNEKQSISELTEKIIRTIEKMDLSYEICFIDDGSTDGSLEALKNIREKNKLCKCIINASRMDPAR